MSGTSFTRRRPDGVPAFVPALVPALALALGLALGLAGCASSGGGPHRRLARVTVFAAASLTNAFGAEATAFRARNLGEVTSSFAGSQSLVAQVEQGAPADVIATADATTMSKVRGRLLGSPHVFARNRLVVITAPGNPKHLATLADLARRGVVVVLAAAAVPAGKYAAAALAAANVRVHARSLEDNVRGVLTKVELGEADAGIVYLSDALSSHGKVSYLVIPSAPTASYEIGALDAEGTSFVRFVLSSVGQAILDRYGFLPP